jgi:hypothetical protein
MVTTKINEATSLTLLYEHNPRPLFTLREEVTQLLAKPDELYPATIFREWTGLVNTFYKESILSGDSRGGLTGRVARPGTGPDDISANAKKQVRVAV